MKRRHVLGLVGGLAAGPVAPAQDTDAELAKKLSNPVASLISAPFQGNLDFGIGERDATRFTLNIQPVVPFSLDADWNLIVRTILPVIDAESPAPGIDDAFGLGDTTQSFFLSPKEPVGGWIVAAGPVALWPTATDTLLGSEKWGLGPTALLLKQTGPFTYGLLTNHIWSIAGDSNRDDLSATFIQPFFSYQTKTKTTFTLNSESSYNWEHEQWTVPVNVVVAQMLRIGEMPVQVFVGGRVYPEKPDGGPEWGLRFGFTLLFPEGGGLQTPTSRPAK